MTQTPVKAIKAFNQDMTCRGFKYETGKTYDHEGKIGLCNAGFHACADHPLDVLSYYPPSSKFCEVELSGEIKTDGSKSVAARISIGTETSLSDLIARAVKYVIDRATPEDGAQATGDWGAASATGDKGAASATGNWGVAMSSGYKGKAKAKEGCALFLVERDIEDKIVSVFSGIVGRDSLKPDTWYRCDGGKAVEVTA